MLNRRPPDLTTYPINTNLLTDHQAKYRKPSIIKIVVRNPVTKYSMKLLCKNNQVETTWQNVIW